MKNTHKLLLIAAFGVSGVLALPTLSMASDHASCYAHAEHIDHEVGAKKALEVFHVLHGDKADSHHVVDEMKHDHPDIEHELEAFVKSGCSAADLEAHAHDDDH